MRAQTAVIALIGSLLAHSPCAFAQIGHIWTYQELMDKADLVVIAECRGTVEKDRLGAYPGFRGAFPTIEFESSFVVQALVKSVASQPRPGLESTLRLRHYKRDMDQWRREHPAAPGMPSPTVVNTGSTLRFGVKASYLLFLVHKDDGLYEPLSGHTFPTDSVYQLAR